MNVIGAALWLVTSAVVGLVRHEGAHWLAFRAFGVPATITLIPSINPQGRLEFGRAIPKPGYPITRAQAAVVNLAPAIAALAWAAGALAFTKATPYAWIEAGTAAVDLGNWLRGALFRLPGTDGNAFLRALNPEVKP